MLDYYFCEECETYHLPNRIINGEILSACECEISTQSHSTIGSPEIKSSSPINQFSMNQPLANHAKTRRSHEIQQRNFQILPRNLIGFPYPNIHNEKTWISNEPLKSQRISNQYQEIGNRTKISENAQSLMRNLRSSNSPENRISTKVISLQPLFSPILSPPKFMIQKTPANPTANNPFPPTLNSLNFQQQRKEEFRNISRAKSFEMFPSQKIGNHPAFGFVSERNEPKSQQINFSKCEIEDEIIGTNKQISKGHDKNIGVRKEESLFTLERVNTCLDTEEEEEICYNFCQ